MAQVAARRIYAISAQSEFQRHLERVLGTEVLAPVGGSLPRTTHEARDQLRMVLSGSAATEADVVLIDAEILGNGEDRYEPFFEVLGSNEPGVVELAACPLFVLIAVDAADEYLKLAGADLAVVDAAFSSDALESALTALRRQRGIRSRVRATHGRIVEELRAQSASLERGAREARVRHARYTRWVGALWLVVGIAIGTLFGQVI